MAKSGTVAVSAISGEGLPVLAGMIDARIAASMEVIDYLLQPSDGARLAWLYEHGEVLGRSDAEEEIQLQVRLTPSDRARFEQMFEQI